MYILPTSSLNSGSVIKPVLMPTSLIIISIVSLSTNPLAKTSLISIVYVYKTYISANWRVYKFLCIYKPSHSIKA